MSSLAGERSRIPFPPSSPPQTPSHYLDARSDSGGRRTIPNVLVLGHQDPYPALHPHEQSLVGQPLILVRDPPRERLAASRTSSDHAESVTLLARVAGKSDFGQRYDSHPDYSPTQSDSTAPVEFYADLFHYYHDEQHTAKPLLNLIPELRPGFEPSTDDAIATMTKRRTSKSSLQAILVPSFLQGPLSPTTSPPTSPTTFTSRIRVLSGATSLSPRASTSTFASATIPESPHPTNKRDRKRSMTFSSLSARVSPPPDFLLDDDPFANLTSAPSESSWRNNPALGSAAALDALAAPSIPRSPLIDPGKNLAIMASSSKAPSSLISSTPPSPLPRARPAHQRPAFKSRPSLPSLDTLARMNVVLTKKVRKGRVGAGLPFEPWDNLPSDDDSVPSTSGPLRQQTTPGTPLPPFVSPVQPGDVFSSSQGPPMVTPQPLLPSQIMALGSIAANVEMIIPVATPRPQSRVSTLHCSPPVPPPPPETPREAFDEQRVPAVTPPLPVENTVAHEEEPAPVPVPVMPVIDVDATFFETKEAEMVEVSSPIEDHADFFDLYHQSSRNGSEDGYEASHTLHMAGHLPILHEKSFEELDKVAIVTTATGEAEVVPVSDELMTYGNENYQDDEFEELEEMSFAENDSFIYSDRPSQDEPIFMQSDSMLFSSPPSSFSLSRSLSTTSRSSCASSDYVGAMEYMENEDGEKVVFGSISPRKDHKYRRLVDPSLSSLELDLDAGLGLGSEQGEQEMENGTSGSSSGRPSLSRTRSSSDYSSDVVRSPLMEDYAFFPHRNHQSPALQQLAASFAQQSIPVAEESAEPFNSDEGPLSGLVGAFEEYQRGVIGDGFGFGFGYDKVMAAEDLEAKAGHDEMSDESLAPGTSPSRAQLVDTSSEPSESAAGFDLLVSQVSDDQHQRDNISLSESLIVQQLTPPPTPSSSQFQFSRSDSQEDMLWPSSSSSSRPSSAIRTSAADLGRSHAGYNGQGSSTNTAAYRGASSSAPTTANSYRRGYTSTNSRGYSGQGRRDDEDEDDDDPYRRRRALERGYGGETVAKEGFSDDSSEDESEERYTSAASSLSSQKSKPQRSRMTRSPSRSPGHSTSPLPSGSNPRGFTKFPQSSSSSRYVSEDDDSEDDDVPLAQAIPGALTAQKTIRRKVREEREQRKREKAQLGHADSHRDRQTTLRPAGAGSGIGAGDLGSSSSRDAAAMAAAAFISSQPQTRQRTLTLPGKAPNPMVLNPHDLARKLQSVQMADVTSPTYPMYGQQFPPSPQNLVSPSSQSALPTRDRSKSFSRPSGDLQHPIYPTPPQTSSLATSPAARSRSISKRSTPFTSPTGANPPPLPTLRPMRSFHRPAERSPSGLDDGRSLAVPVDEEQRSSRTSATSMAPTHGSHESQHSRSMSLSRRSNDRERMDRLSPAEPVPALPANIRTSQEEYRKTAKLNPEPRLAAAPRTSAEAERPAKTSNQQPTGRVVVTQQRVFVGNLQQFHMVEISPNTTAGDVVALMESQGALVGWAGTGGWMVFEVAQDFGMERPIRSYELLVDIQSSWLKDKTVNYFMLKLTPLASTLARSAIPSSSPTHSGYIEWESRRGKWSKRWVQLKEHSIYLSKRDNGKDEVLICSLSNFDAYRVTRPYKAPKPFTFSVKSTDKLSFFENTDDYMHTFSCSEKDGKIWMEKILIARSYVLYQERNVLFGSKPSGNGAPSSNTVLSRTGTRKSSSSAQRPVQPLVNMPPFLMASAVPSLPHANVFEPGSLLSRQT